VTGGRAWRVLPVGIEAAGDLAALHARCFEEAWSAEAFAALLAGGQGFVAGDGAPLGFALARAAADEAEIVTLGVLAEARRQALGHRLMQAVVAWAEAAGAQAIHLEVAEHNAAARALYRRYGFVPVGRRPGYYQGRDALILSRRLLAG
jgi:[ribosomal protein S18]-alanine N-acetyltransferase